jgi:hypothetical protein
MNSTGQQIFASSDVGIAFCCPRLPRLQRQLRERGQYWGPEQIQAEHIVALKESWRQCVDERVLQGMFGAKMEDQLATLQSWAGSARSQFDDSVEVLDMLFKWLTWLLVGSPGRNSASPQVLKLVIEVLRILLEGLAASSQQLTERETQILIPNLLERSGHNLGTIREGVSGLLRNIIHTAVVPRSVMLPLALHGLSSRNKHSAHCAARILGDVLDDRLVAHSLARSQKDMMALGRASDHKDTDVKKAVVLASGRLLGFLTGDAFDRALKVFPISAQMPVRGAVVRPEENVSAVMPVLPAAKSNTSIRAASGSRRAAPSITSDQCPAAGPTTLASPGRGSRGDVRPMQSTMHSAPLLLAGVAPMQDIPVASSPVTFPASPLVLPDPSSQVIQILKRMEGCSLEEYKVNCGELTDRLKHKVSEGDLVPLATGIVSAMRSYFGNAICADRCWCIVAVLDEFCSSKDCLRPLPQELLKGILRELMRNLYHNQWTQGLENGEAFLRKLNLACVMFLQGLPRAQATYLLLSLGSDESTISSSNLTAKCLKKLAKLYTMADSYKDPDSEKVGELFDVLRTWLKREQPQLAPGGAGAENPALMMDGVRAIAEAAQRANPEAARLWLSAQIQIVGEKDWAIAWFQKTFSTSEKENATEAMPAGRSSAYASKGAADSRAPARASSLEKRRQSAPPANCPLGSSPMNVGR